MNLTLLLKVHLRKITERSEEHTSELQSRPHLVCRLLLEKKKEASLRDAKFRIAKPGGISKNKRAKFERIVEKREKQLQRGLYREDRFFFNDTATTEIYTLSLHDALPI